MFAISRLRSRAHGIEVKIAPKLLSPGPKLTNARGNALPTCIVRVQEEMDTQLIVLII
jgi:hypothetical protein